MRMVFLFIEIAVCLARDLDRPRWIICMQTLILLLVLGPLHCIVLYWRGSNYRCWRQARTQGVVAGGGGGVNNVLLARQSDRSYVRRYPYIPTLLSGKLAHFIFFFFSLGVGRGERFRGYSIHYTTLWLSCIWKHRWFYGMPSEMSGCFKHDIASGAKKHILKTTLPHKNSPRINRLIQNLWSWCHFTREKKSTQWNKQQWHFVNDIVEITDHWCCVLSGPICMGVGKMASLDIWHRRIWGGEGSWGLPSSTLWFFF